MRVQAGASLGWALVMACIGAGGAAGADGPSYDCARASGPVETAVCADPDLAQLDRELARVYRLARKAPDADRLVPAQRRWLEVRDSCAAAADRHLCLRDAYVARIAGLRQGLADETAGLSLGPFVYRCDGLTEPVVAVFVNTDASVVHLRRDGSGEVAGLVLPAAMSASGARYAGPTPGGAAEFWVKGETAMLTLPGPARVHECAVVSGG